MKTTMVSDLMASLQVILDRDGDMPVAANGNDYVVAAVVPVVNPNYYDGGYIMPETDIRQQRAWVRSRTHKRYPSFVRLQVIEPCEEDDTRDGVEIGE